MKFSCVGFDLCENEQASNIEIWTQRGLNTDELTIGIFCNLQIYGSLVAGKL
jgi:hypothetical protein